MITSFTRAAAREIATKKSRETNLPIEVPEQNVGTMHSICFHALNQPKLMEVDLINEWNAEQPQLAITGQRSSFSSMDNAVDDTSLSTEQGDELLSKMNIYRNKILPDTMWPMSIRSFKKKWDDFKRENDAMDFTDLIETAVNDLPYAPSQPHVLFVDEAQDFTKLQLKLARNWGMEMEWIVLVGDDDQTIYHFTGADPFAFLLPPVPDNMKTVLKQSFRLPLSVMERANELIEKIEKREPKIFAPRKEKNSDKIAYGETNDRDFTYKMPEEIIEEASDYIADGKRVMLLASCSYMLKPAITILNSQGIPYSNEYRRNRADWNPLASRKTGVSAKDLLLSFLSSGSDSPYWNVVQFVNWAQFITTKGDAGLIRGKGKKAIKTLKEAINDSRPGLHSTRTVLTKIMEPDAIQPALDRNVDWFVDNLIASKRKTLEYPLKVTKKFGRSVLEKEPLLTIGTIHSVKGAEADVVYIVPDISWKAEREYDTQIGRDSIHRVFYVGMTRAKEILNIGQPAASKYKQVKAYVEF